MPILGLSLCLFPSILSSSTNFIRLSPLTTCPIQFFFLSHIVFIKLFFSFMELSTCSFVLLSIQLTFPILLHTHISKAFKRFIPSFLIVHVSHLYRTTGHTSVLTNLFLRPTLILLVCSSFLLLNTCFAIPILVLTSSKHLPSSEINEPRYLNLLTCSMLLPSTVMFTLSPPFLKTTIAFVFLMLIFISSCFAVVFRLYIKNSVRASVLI